MDERDFLIQRYKYILDQKKSLNQTTFKIMALYQAVMLAVGTAQFKIIADRQAEKLTSSIAILGSWSLLFASIFVSLLCGLLLASGIASWLKYRKDEQLIEVIVNDKARSLPRFLDIFRWYETYLLLSVILVVICHGIVLGRYVIPIL